MRDSAVASAAAAAAGAASTAHEYFGKWSERATTHAEVLRNEFW